MKRAILLLTIFSIFSISCSSDENDTAINTTSDSNNVGGDNNPSDAGNIVAIEKDAPKDSEKILPTQMLVKESDGTTYTIKYSYEGMKLVKEDWSTGYYTNYVYSEDGKLIKTVADFDGIVEETYSYNDQGKINKIVFDFPDNSASQNTNLLEYSNSDNTITFNSPQRPNAKPVVLTLDNGNVISVGDKQEYFSTYTYDTKNAPFKNVENRTVLVSSDSENIYSIDFTLNNPLTEVYQENYNFNSNTGTFEDTDFDTNSDVENTVISYTYTEYDYPRVKTENIEGDITTYTYTYNND